jgi:hypothetical protein
VPDVALTIPTIHQNSRVEGLRRDHGERKKRPSAPQSTEFPHSLSAKLPLTQMASNGSSQPILTKLLQHDESPVWIAAAKQDIFEADLSTGQKQTCVRPVCAAHAAAGPDGFRKPSPKPQYGQ